MNKMQAKDWCHGMLAYIWEETGNGQLRLVTVIRKDFWIVTGMCSWCCCGDTMLYVGTEAKRIEQEKLLRANLANRRLEWSRR